MKVALKHILPNPWRYINKGYPIDKAKVEKLRSSIKRTGFWDNLVGRKGTNGNIEIAYGHHRIEACKQEFTPDHEIDVIIRDLDDATMLKIMAAENDALDVMSPAVINETIRAARDFINQNPTLRGCATAKNSDGVLRESDVIADFLAWPVGRVQDSLAALADLEAGHIDRDEYESLPYQEIAEKYRREIKKNPLPKEERKKIIYKIKNKEIGTKHIRQEILKAKFPNGNGKKKDQIMLEDIADKVASNIRECSTLLTDTFIENVEHLNPSALDDLSVAVNSLYKKLFRINGKLGDKAKLLIGGVNDAK